MNALVRDIRFAVRSMVAAPRFSLAVIATLALGLGANTAVFSVLDAALLTPLPYPQSDRLVRVYLQREGDRKYLPGAALIDLRATSETLDIASVYTYTELSADLTDRRDPERVRLTAVSSNYFRVMGVPPTIGRAFEPDEERADARVAIVSDRIWREYLGASADAVGRTLSIDSRAFHVVGVMPPAFEDALQPAVEIWIPEDLQPNGTNSWGNNRLSAVARLRPGASLETARAEGRVLAARQAPNYGARVPIAIQLEPLHADLVGAAGPMLYVLLGAVALLLLLACVNVASLMLARATGRAQEMAVRAALGCSRWQLVRQLLAESLLLSVSGGLVGLALAHTVSRVLLAASPVTIVQPDAAAFDGSVFAYGFAVALVAGLIFGLAPALQASKPDLERVLRESSRGAGTSRRQARLWNGLVIAQVAIALVLLVGAGLLLKGFVRLRGLDLGFQPANVITFQVNLPQGRYDDADRRRQFHVALHERIAALPGVRAAGAISRLPVTGTYHSWGTRRPGDDAFIGPEQRVIEGRYFEALGIPILSGRAFGAEDTADVGRRVVISQSLADALYPGVDPVGRDLHVFSSVVRIIGVVGDVPLNARGTIGPAVYHSHTQFAANRNWMLTQVVSTSGATAGMLDSIRRELRAIDPALVLYEPRLLEDVVGRGRARERFALALVAGFAAIALVLGAIGLYGVLSYAVTSRRTEIGIRLALGARTADVRRMVVGRGARLAAAGLVAGAFGALALTRALQSLLFGVSAQDPLVFVAAASLLAAVALAAAWLPAMAATRVNPVETLGR